MANDHLLVENQIAHLLQQGQVLTVRWDCGGDESFVTTEVDGVEQEADYGDKQNFAVLLDRYITETLNLPDVGEFSMQGTGRIFQEGQDIILDYESRATTYWDDDDDSWKDEFTAEQLADMGLSPRESAPLPAGELAASESQPLTSEEATGREATDLADEDGDDEPGGTYDPDMSEDYSGRLVLFVLP
jgi:hypothetical protein